MVIGYVYTNMTVINGHVRFSFKNHVGSKVSDKEPLHQFIHYLVHGEHEVDLHAVCAKRQIIW